MVLTESCLSGDTSGAVRALKVAFGGLDFVRCGLYTAGHRTRFRLLQ